MRRRRKLGESTSPWPPTSWPERSELSEANRTVEIVNKRGLHARASAKFVKLAATFDAEVKVTKDGATVDARSIMGLMMLAAGIGSHIDIRAEGPEADAAIEALADLVENRFEEER